MGGRGNEKVRYNKKGSVHLEEVAPTSSDKLCL